MIGPRNTETPQIAASLSRVLLAEAKIDESRHQFQEADLKITSTPSPLIPPIPMAQAMKKDNDKSLALQSGRIPSKEVQALIPAFQTNMLNSQTLVQDARVFYEAGKFDEAEIRLVQAKKLDPENLSASHYLELLSERRAAQATRITDESARIALLKVDQAYEVPLRGQQRQAPNQFIRTNIVSNSKGRQKIRTKLERIQIDNARLRRSALVRSHRHSQQEIRGPRSGPGGDQFHV